MKINKDKNEKELDELLKKWFLNGGWLADEGDNDRLNYLLSEKYKKS